MVKHLLYKKSDQKLLIEIRLQSKLKMIDYLSQWMSLIRFSILSTIFLLNLGSLVRLMIFNVKSDKRNNQHCVHTVTNSLIVLANLFYLLTWIPYLGLSMYDANYLNVNAIEQCILQYLLSSVMTTLLLTVLVIRKIYCCFNCQNAKVNDFFKIKYFFNGFIY